MKLPMINALNHPIKNPLEIRSLIFACYNKQFVIQRFSAKWFTKLKDNCIPALKRVAKLPKLRELRLDHVILFTNHVKVKWLPNLCRIRKSQGRAMALRGPSWYPLFILLRSCKKIRGRDLLSERKKLAVGAVSFLGILPQEDLEQFYHKHHSLNEFTADRSAKSYATQANFP